MMEYLRVTADAGSLGEGVGMAAAGGGGKQMFANAMNILTAGMIGLAGHAYQGTAVRNLMLRFYHAKGNVANRDAIMMQITPLLMVIGRDQLQAWDESDPQDLTYVSDEFLEMEGERNQGLIEQGMDQLRAAADDEEDPGITSRLLQMIGIGGEEEEEAPVE
jgi:hypothetical protein